MKPIKYEDMTKVGLVKRVNSNLFTTMKRNGKFKARWVAGAGARRQSRDDFESLYAGGTGGKPQNLTMALKVAANQGRCIARIDIQAAFLQPELPEVKPPHKEHFRRILQLNVKKDENIIKHLRKIDPDLEKHVYAR